MCDWKKKIKSTQFVCRGAKQETLKKKQQSMQQSANRNHQQSSPAPTKLSMKPKLTHLNRGLVALVRK